MPDSIKLPMTPDDLHHYAGMEVIYGKEWRNKREAAIAALEPPNIGLCGRCKGNRVEAVQRLGKASVRRCGACGGSGAVVWET